MNPRTVFAPLAFAAATAAACGQAFTTGADDAGQQLGLDASVDAAPIDGAVADAHRSRDAEARDAIGDEGGRAEAGPSPPPVDAGPIDATDASACLRVCPSGFDCLLGKCVDRADVHFEAQPTGGNWSYGSFASFGSSGFVAYAATWTTNGIIFVSRTKDVLNLSVFRSTTPATYAGMTIPAAALGLYPATVTNEDSVVRWTAPMAGRYAIDATFTGLGAAPKTMVGANVNIGQSVMFGQTINASGAANSVVYSNLGQLMSAGDTVDFYIAFVTANDDLQGGTELDAHITAE